MFSGIIIFMNLEKLCIGSLNRSAYNDTFIFVVGNDGRRGFSWGGVRPFVLIASERLEKESESYTGV